VSQGPREEHEYGNNGRMDKLEGAEELGYDVCPVQLMLLSQ
jgi:hypothetical protein